nr:hypothetical protein [Pseudoalteromonas sp. H105]
MVGSNSGNILLILGLCAVITPLTISALALKCDASVMLAWSVMFCVMAYCLLPCYLPYLHLLL